MYEYRQALMRMRQGDSEREIARSKLMGRSKAARFRELARAQGWLNRKLHKPHPFPARYAVINCSALRFQGRRASKCSTVVAVGKLRKTWRSHRYGSTTLHPHLALAGGRPAGLVEHLDRGLVHVDDVMPEQHIAHQVGDRLQCPCGADHPACQGLARHEHARAGEHVLEARQWQPIDVFDDDQQGQQVVAGVALGQHLRRGAGADRRLVALGAAVALADMAKHAYLHRDDVELFADVLADLDHRGAAGAGALGLGDIIMDDVDARQLDGQGLALTARLLLAGVGRGLARRLAAVPAARP